MTAVDNSSVLDYALAYAARGWRVVPIKPKGKHPPIDEWQKVASTDPDRVNEMWSRWYRHGVGIATGRESGIFVLDVDVSDGKRGDDSLADLEATYGQLPATVECVTGSGGRHLYFRYPDGAEVRNDAGKRLGPGLDIRGEGGQVLAPPTIHPNGIPYAWEVEGDPLDGIAVAEAPAWLLRLLTQTPAEQPRAERTPYIGVPRPGDLFAATTTWPELLVPDGATFLGRRIEHRSGHPYEIWARPGADHTSATLGYGGSDVLKVFTPNWPGLAEGETYSKFAYYTVTRHNGDFSAAARAIREQLGPSAPPEAPSEPEPASPNRMLIHWPTFWAQDSSDEDWFAYPVLPAKRGVSINAAAKTGKSLLMLYIAAAIATGRPCLGQQAQKPRPVLYMDYEMVENDLRERLEEMGYGPEADLSLLHYALMPSIPPLDTAPGGAEVVALARELGVEAVIVDTFSRVISREENDNKAAQEFYRFVGSPLKAVGIGVYRLDHVGKDPTLGVRGGSAKNDDVDVVWNLVPSDNGLRLKRTHSRVNWVPASADLVRSEGPLAFRFDPSDVAWPVGTKEVARLLDDLGLPLDVSRRAALKALKDAGEGRNNNLVAAAIRWRKAEQPLFLDNPKGLESGTGYHLAASGTDQIPVPLADTPSDLPVPLPVPPGTTLPGKWVPGGTSIGGTTGPSPTPEPPDDEELSLL